MTLAQAQAAAGQLRVALLDNGVRAVSFELQQGVAGSGWGVAPFKRGMGHHIVSRPPGTPGLALVKRGRPDLGGPLCNGYGGYDLVARIITMAWANHPGAGGPWTVPSWGTVPRDNGRPYIFGWEFEGGLEPYTDEMHDFMARCGAGTLDWLATLPGNPGLAPLECWGEHKDPWAPGRKVDRLGYTAATGRSRIATVRNQEDDMQAGELYQLKGSDGRNLFDSILQTRAELRDRAADALFQTRFDGRNVFDWLVQASLDRAAAEAREAARDAALLEVVKASGSPDPKVVADAVTAAAERALADADFPTAEQIAQATLAAQERAELERLRARVAELEQAAAGQPAA